MGKGCLIITIIIVVVVCIVTYPFMWLWNWLMPDIFGVGEVSFWQAFGLLTLIAMIGGYFKNRNKK